MPKVSVIVPVFNAEVYIERAVVTLMEQTLDDIEFIIIDDGSSDNSFAIIKQVVACYPSRSEQVILISRQNKGVATTRAQGIELATGDYVIHFDSDDWVDLNWLELLYNKAVEKNADVVVCNYVLDNLKTQSIVMEHVSENASECVRLLLLGYISNSSWNKLVKNSLLRDNCITFYGGYDMGEDFLFSFLVFMNAGPIAFINDAPYHYNRSNENSLTKNYSQKAINDLVSIVRLTDSHLIKTGRKSFYDRDFSVFVLGIKAQCVYHFHGDKTRVKNAFDNFYPETNRLVFLSSFKVLKFAYFMHICNSLIVYEYIHALWKWLKLKWRIK